MKKLIVVIILMLIISNSYGCMRYFSKDEWLEITKGEKLNYDSKRQTTDPYILESAYYIEDLQKDIINLKKNQDFIMDELSKVKEKQKEIEGILVKSNRVNFNSMYDIVKNVNILKERQEGLFKMVDVIKDFLIMKGKFKNG